LPVHAHTENSDGYSTIRIETTRVSYDLSLDYFELARVVRLGVPRGAPAAVYRTALTIHREELERYLAVGLTVSLDGVSCTGEVAATDVERRLERDYARIRLLYSCPGTQSGAMAVRYGLLFDDSDPSHRNLVHYQAEGEQGQFVFTTAERELSIGRGNVPGQALRFVELGFEHILSGYDHVLFVIVLLLGASRLIDVIRVLSVFTLAHSVTLAATLTGLARFPAEIVEPLIALSIAYVAVENLHPAATRCRLPVVFGFGLVHGMGFGAALQFTGAQQVGLAVPLLSFNLGIELGQALIAALVFPTLLLIRSRSWSRLAHGLVQGTISAFGLVWYFARLMS
jgi:hydrogenase/urease accessory protein HupE